MSFALPEIVHVLPWRGYNPVQIKSLLLIICKTKGSGFFIFNSSTDIAR